MKRLPIKSAALGITLLISAPSLLAADYTQHWAKDAIEKWSNYQVVKGYENGDFRPNNPITRAEFTTLLDRVFKWPQASGPAPYMDIIAAPHKWYVTSVNKAADLQIMHIDGFLFEPDALVTREEAAYAMMKAYDLVPVTEEKTYFKDEAQIAPWAKEAVQTLAHYGYIEGTPEGNFSPKSTLTRAEIVTMLDHMTSQLITTSEPMAQSIKGNVVINSLEATLKHLTIEGNLYITAGVSKATLDQVTVTGTVYIKGGSVQMSGTYQEVQLEAGMPIELVTGTIEKLIVTQAGSHLKLGENAAIKELVQNAPIEIEGQGKIGQTEQAGQTGQADQIQEIEIFISGTPVQFPVSNQSILIDIPSLSQQFSTSDTIDGFRILDTTYTFKALEEQLGLIREIATEVALPPNLLIQQLLGEDPVTLGSLLDNYAIGKQLADSLGYTLKDSYTFERLLTNNQGDSQTIYITLRLQS